jgi:hypothetical protein
MKKLLFENNDVKIELDNSIIITTWKISFADLEMAHKAVALRLKYCNSISYPLLSDIKLIKSSTKAARDFLASKKGAEGVTAAAILIDSVIGSMMGNFFIRINKPIVPTKLFMKKKLKCG